MGTLSVVGIILLFFRPRGEAVKKDTLLPETREELFSQVIAAAGPDILKLWEEGDTFIGKEPPTCPDELVFQASVGRSYYQCQPHFWQCYWHGGVTKAPSLKVDLFGQTYHIEARPVFNPIKEYSDKPRYYRMFKRENPGINLHYGYVVEIGVREIPGFYQPMVLSDSCRDVYLPERIYPYGQEKNQKDEGLVWDNFDRRIFIDKFYVSNQQVNEWRLLSGQSSKFISDRTLWPFPALLDRKEQKAYCNFFGKRVMEAHLFDAATMSPGDLKNSTPERVLRPKTPWQRDISKTFIGKARVNDDYQLEPLDCQLAQVEGCTVRLFSTDSTTWMGINYALGYWPESFFNPFEPDKNLKLSSHFLPAYSEWHELGLRSSWSGEQGKELAVAFRCYEEVAP